jgi:hypothetical protein
MKMYYKGIGYSVCAEWLELTQASHQCRALMNTAMNLRAPQRREFHEYLRDHQTVKKDFVLMQLVHVMEL